jgi:serine/threonine-protein kinase
VEILPISRDALEGAENRLWLAVTYAWTGEQQLAIEQLSSVATLPNGPTYGELKLDPLWDDLREDPRFEQILAEAAKPIPLK